MVSKKWRKREPDDYTGVGYGSNVSLQALCWACNGLKWGELRELLVALAKAVYGSRLRAYVVAM